MAAKTKISELGSSICVDDQNEKFVPALGNGTAVPGDACGIDVSTGRVVGTDVGNLEEFIGLLMESKITGTETAPVADAPSKLVIPKSGHGYRVRILDTVDAEPQGEALDFSATPYKFDSAADIIHAICRLSLPTVDDDTVAEVTWA